MVRAKAEIAVQDDGEGLRSQARGDQHHQREDDLTNDQELSQTLASHRRSRTARFLERACQVHSISLKHRRNRKEQHAQNSNSDGIEHRSGVYVHAAIVGQIAAVLKRNRVRGPFSAQVGDEQAQSNGGGHQQSVF